MKVFLATDHAGLTIKNNVNTMLTDLGYDVQDCGAFDFDKDDDYPDFISKAAEGVSNDPENSRGIVFGGSGQGEAIVANKFKNIRCALFYSPAIANDPINIEGEQNPDPFAILQLTREHNNANMLSIGFRFLKEEDILKGIKLWLETPGATAERHLRRIEKIKQLEN